MNQAVKHEATFFRLKVDEIDRAFEIAVVPSLAICSCPDALECALVSPNDIAPDKNWIYGSDLLFSPTQITGLRKDSRYVRTGESILFDPERIVLPDYKTPWPPFLPFELDTPQWRVLPQYDRSKAYLVNDPALTKPMDYAGSVGAYDLYYKVVAHILLADGLDPMPVVERMKPNPLQLSMVRAIKHDHERP